MINLKIDHIGYAVNDISDAVDFFCSIGFSAGEIKHDKMRNVDVAVAWDAGGGVKVELLSPIKGKPSPIDGYLNKLGSTPYHICYQTDDMECSIKWLQDNGFTIIAAPGRSVPLQGTVAFLYSVSVGLIEIISYEM